LLGGPAGRDADSRCCWPTRATTATRSARHAARGTEPVIARRGGKNIKGLDRLRYVVEQTFGLSTSSVVWPSAGNAALTFATPSSALPAP
jgi:hypothetical protein